MNARRGKREKGESSMSKHQVPPGCGDSVGSCGRDDQTCLLAKPVSQVRTGTGNKLFICSFTVQLHEQDY